MITPNITNELTITLLLLTLGTVLAIAAALGVLVLVQVRHQRAKGDASQAGQSPKSRPVRSVSHAFTPDSPCRWCAIRTHSLGAVQSALGLHNTRPCSWDEGMSLLEEHKLLISPPVEGWVLVIGNGLPNPGDDVDACFRFLLNLGRELHQVQFFSLNRAVNHHAWVRLENGKIFRAYAWAGETLWNQGPLTRAEAELGLKCFPYGESGGEYAASANDVLQANTDKVHSLAGAWSLDPSRINDRIDHSREGIVGDVAYSKHR